jgi:CRP/FNR family cyclic AMP-dependent transcriptional regulator
MSQRAGEMSPGDQPGTLPRRTARGWALEPLQLHAYLLDLDEELAEQVDGRLRMSARRSVTARALEAEAGDCDLGPWLDELQGGPGLLVLDGLLAADVSIADRTASELVGSGDLISPPFHRQDEMIEQVPAWRALATTRLAVLDGEFMERMRPWPAILRSLVHRAERRGDDLAFMRAICSQPKLELRLVLLLWHLGVRWGRVEPGGLRLSLPLTHRLLGQLVAAERPSVSHALGRLARAGLVIGSTGDLHLRGTLEGQLEQLSEPGTHGGVHAHTHTRVRPRAPQRGHA